MFAIAKISSTQQGNQTVPTPTTTQTNVDSSNVDLQQILQNAQLPALPQSAIRLLELSQDPVNGPAEFAIPIESDPGLAGQVLRFVNSSYFGFSREISSVKLAITLVGIRTIKNFSLWSAVFSLMPNPKCGPFDLKKLWQDSLRRGLFARDVGKVFGLKDSEEPFAAALLQDMAVPLLAKELASEYESMLNQCHDGQHRLSELELERFGWTHSEAACKMAKSWNLPSEFSDLIKVHAKLDDLAADENPDPSQLAVALSSLLPSACDEQWSDGERFEEVYNQFRGADAPSISELLNQVDLEFVEFAPVLKLSALGKSLVDYYEEFSETKAEQT